MTRLTYRFQQELMIYAKATIPTPDCQVHSFYGLSLFLIRFFKRVLPRRE